MNITYIISYNIDWIELNWNSIFQTPQQPWKTLQILVFFPTCFSNNNQPPQTKATGVRNNHFAIFPNIFSTNQQPKATKPNQTKRHTPFFPDLFFKTNNSNQQQQRAEEQPFCYFPQHFFNQPTTQSNQTKPSQAKPNQTSQQRHTPDCFFSWPFFQNKQQQSTATKSRGTTILLFSPTFFQPTNNPKQPNQTKPSQAKPNQTSQQRHTPDCFFSWPFFQNKQQQSTATKSRGTTILPFSSTFFQPTNNPKQPNQTKPSQTKPNQPTETYSNFFPDLFFKTNNTNQQQQRAEEEPFCIFLLTCFQKTSNPPNSNNQPNLGVKHYIFFHYIYGMSSFPLTNSYFSRFVIATTNQP